LRLFSTSRLVSGHGRTFVAVPRTGSELYALRMSIRSLKNAYPLPFYECMKGPDGLSRSTWPHNHTSPPPLCNTRSRRDMPSVSTSDSDENERPNDARTRPDCSRTRPTILRDWASGWDRALRPSGPTHVAAHSSSSGSKNHEPTGASFSAEYSDGLRQWGTSESSAL
jgi:hypothetical protein